MRAHETRKMVEDDHAAVTALLDATIGRGFWDAERDLTGIARVLVMHGRIVGIGVASMSAEPPEGMVLAAPVGYVRLVAVDPSVRRRGIATQLVSELSGQCESLGAASLAAYAWVHAPLGLAPLAGALERDGYVLDHRIEGFYAGACGDPCPACGQSACVCPADVYWRITSLARG